MLSLSNSESPSKSQDDLACLYNFQEFEEAVADIADSATENYYAHTNTGGGALLTGDNCPIQDLPTELLCLIFAESLQCHARYTRKYATTPITLKRVCRQWESIICDLSSFWKSLVLHHYPTQDLEDALKTYFRFGRLGKLDVDISLYGDLENTYPLKRMTPLQLIRSNLRHFQSIVGRIHPTALHELFGKEYIYDLSAIRTLTLTLKDSEYYTHTFDFSEFRCSDSFQLAAVESLELYNFGYLLSNSNVKSSLPCLTRLSLKGDNSAYLLDHTTIFTILSVSFNLQDFSWTPGQYLGEWLLLEEEFHLLASSSIKLPKLTTLHINFQPFSADAAAVICVLQMPNLTEFSVSGCNLTTMNHETYLYQMIEYFISTRGNRIYELALDNLLVNSEDWKRYIRLMPNLEKLYTDGQVLADGFFQYLTDDDSIVLRLPKLQYLTMFRCGFNDQELDAFVRFAKDRGRDARGGGNHPSRCAQLKTLQLGSVTWGGSGHAEFEKLVNEYADLNWGESLMDLKPINSPRALAMEIRFDSEVRKKTLTSSPRGAFTNGSWG